jgi:hypothetical protein
MNITLKNFKYSPSLSEETIAFTADVYADGVRIAYAKNQGHGGCTFVHAYADKSDQYKAAVAACGGSLEEVIDNLVEKVLMEKDQKKIKKKFANCVIWGVPNSSGYTEAKFQHPIAVMLANDKGKEFLKKQLAEYKKDFKEGEVFWNDNLPEDILPK